VSKSSYLISIVRRQQVAQIHGKPIYVITEVALTPLTSKTAAEAAIVTTNTGLQRRAIDGHVDESDSDSDEGDFSAAASDDVEDEEEHATATIDATLQDANKGPHRERSVSVAEDVMTRKGGYGRFAEKWFSKKGWTVDQRRNQGMSAAATGSGKITPVEGGSSEEQKSVVAEAGETLQPEDVKAQAEFDFADNLLPKLLKTTQLLFGSSRSFFFAYDYDITRSLANKKPASNSEVPLHKEVDPLFFWNRGVIHPFIDAGQYSYVLPLMQGFVCQQPFTVDRHPVVPIPDVDAKGSPPLEMQEMSPEHGLHPGATAKASDSHNQSESECSDDDPGRIASKTKRHSSMIDESRTFLLTLISRRSVKRPGLRYLRRGVDDDGNTANNVETEQILSSVDWSPSSKIYSFMQLRGSIPVFFSQSPYSFKPVPQLQHSADTNFRAFQKHFSGLMARYGLVQTASLVEKHGNEAIVGEEYEKNMARLNESGGINGAKVGFEWFDFHAMTRGMKFDNVNILMDSLSPTLDSFGNSVEVDGKLESKQCGILRTNCMDCLDRTNVVQSAFGRRALELQLKEEGIDLSAQIDQTTSWFNSLWADNGDAISKQYASTAALKGDFTRTRKRNYKGALTDMGLSISRFYSG
jgi:hypothetical protein